MTETLRWWLAATVIGLITVPYAFRLFRFLPDRGLILARTLGVVLVVYALWMLSVLGLATYGAGPAVLLLGLMAGGAVILAGRDRVELGAHVRAHLRLLIAAEVVFGLVLFGLAAFRAYAPEIDATEKLFEFSMFNGVLRSGTMPPADPWFGGEPISYYYGGYLVAALFTHLTHVPASYGFNLGVVMTGALAALGTFGLGANLIMALTARRRDGAHPRGATAPILAGALSVMLLLVIGNLEGVFELAAAHGRGSSEFYRRLGIVNLTGLVHTKEWYPDEFWYWWRATRMGSDWNIMEFPFFSFMLGDLHAHVMVLPYTILGLGALLNLLRAGQRLDLTAVRRHPLMVLFLGLLAGMLALSNTWDQPVFLVVLTAVAFVANSGSDGISWRACGGALLFAVPVAVLSFALYVPFFLYLHPASLSLQPVLLTDLPPGVNGEGMVLPPHHFLIVWGPLVAVAASGIVAYAMQRRVWRAPSVVWTLALSIALLPLALWAVAVIGGNGGVGGLVDEVNARATWWAFGSYWLVQAGVVLLCLLGLLAVLIDLGRPHPERRAARVYIVLTVVTGLVLVHVIELFYFQEQAIVSRINTLFKFSFIVWLLLATAGGAILVDVGRSWWRGRGRAAPALWTAGIGALLALALVYPVTAAMNRTEGFTRTPTLDGLAFLKATDRAEYDAIAWMSANLPGRPVILEAAGDVYSQAGRVSGRTGLPTVIGWKQHEEKLRGGRDYKGEVEQVEARAADVQRIYTTADPAEARDLLKRYAVAYVYLGRLELEKYGSAGLEKFDRLGHVIYRNQSVTLWALDGGEATGGASASGGSAGPR